MRIQNMTSRLILLCHFLCLAAGLLLAGRTAEARITLDRPSATSTHSFRPFTAWNANSMLMADAADAAAARHLAGGNLWLAGEPGMVAELAGRAGGLCGAKVLPAENSRRRWDTTTLFFGAAMA